MSLIFANLIHKNEKMKSFIKSLFYLTVLLTIISCQDDDNENLNSDKTWVFVACEGNFGASNGSISMINELGEVYSLENVGDVVQSLEVYEDKLFVIVNNSSLIKAYDITEEGLSLPGIEISTNGSSPREMKILNDKLYFTNWNSNDVKILNLNNYVIEDSIPVDGKPESIEIYENDIYVGIQLNDDYSDSNQLLKINIDSNSISEIFEIGNGPTSIKIFNDNIFVANTFYDSSFNAFYGSSRIDLTNDQVSVNNYGSGTVCGGSVLKYNSDIYRSYQGGIAILDEQLNILEETKIGSYNPSQLYSSEVIGDLVYFGITNYTDINQVKVVDFNNNEIASYEVGLFPGDFAFWSQNN